MKPRYLQTMDEVLICNNSRPSREKPVFRLRTHKAYDPGQKAPGWKSAD
jgi:hypothetical protein